MTIFSGKNYATHPGSSENNANRKSVFSLRIFPRMVRDLPDDGEVLLRFGSGKSYFSEIEK